MSNKSILDDFLNGDVDKNSVKKNDKLGSFSTDEHKEIERKEPVKSQQVEQSTKKLGSNQPRENKGNSLPPVNVKKDNSKNKRYVMIGAGVIVSGLLVGYLMVGNRVKVPDLELYTTSQISTWGSENGVTVLYLSEYSEDVESGKLISQSIESGYSIKKGESLMLNVSLGADPSVEVTVPEFDEGWTQQMIKDWIAENKLSNATVKTTAHDTIEKNNFVEVDIDSDDEEITRKTKMVFYVSTGSPDLIEMVDLTGETESDMRTWAQTNGITLVIEKISNDLVYEGGLVSQSIEDGVEFNPKDEILTVQISSGPGIEIPNFHVMSTSDIENFAKTNGLSLFVTETYHDTVSTNSIISSSVAENDVVAKGDTIELTMSLGKVPVESFVGKTELDFIKWIDEQNKKGAALESEIIYQYEDANTKNKIIGQSLQTTFVNTGSKVQVVVNLGAFVTVPNLVSLNEWDARQACSDHSLVCTFTYDYSESVVEGSVISQNKTVGSNISEGDMLSAVISKGPKY